jgi:TetR/AcrR family tetracycline transcriptional repressor
MATRKAPPKERLSRSVIVDDALRVADAEGLDAVTIRRLAQDHDVTPMALYWHFKDKDQLLDGVAEQLFALVDLPAEPEGGAWDRRLAVALNAFLAVLREHPNVADLPLTRALASAAGLRVAEHTLGLLREGGFSPDDAAEVGSFLLCAVTALVTGEPGPEKTLGGEDRDAAVRTRRAHLMSLAPQAFPSIIAAADTLADCRSEDHYFTRGVELLVGGVVSLARISVTGA